MEQDEVRVQPTQVEAQPTDEQANAFLNGDRSAVELPKEQPQPKAEVTPPAPQTAPPVQSNDEIKALKEQLNRINSELGQFRKKASESPKPQPQVPASWAALKPEERAQLQELVKASLLEDPDWKATQESRQAFQEMVQEQQLQQNITRVESLAKSFAGDSFKELDPIMERLYVEFKAKAEAGDEEAAQIVWEARNTRGGIKYLVDLAKQEMGDKVATQKVEATAQLTAAGKKAGTTLGTAPIQQAPSIMNNLPDDPAQAAAMLRKELVKRGALV